MAFKALRVGQGDMFRGRDPSQNPLIPTPPNPASLLMFPSQPHKLEGKNVQRKEPEIPSDGARPWLAALRKGQEYVQSFCPWADSLGSPAPVRCSQHARARTQGDAR